MNPLRNSRHDQNPISPTTHYACRRAKWHSRKSARELTFSPEATGKSATKKTGPRLHSARDSSERTSRGCSCGVHRFLESFVVPVEGGLGGRLAEGGCGSFEGKETMKRADGGGGGCRMKFANAPTSQPREFQRGCGGGGCTSSRNVRGARDTAVKERRKSVASTKGASWRREQGDERGGRRRRGCRRRWRRNAEKQRQKGVVRACAHHFCRGTGTSLIRRRRGNVKRG